jgi:hypothetical protein
LTVLDAYAVLAYLRGERCADDVAGLLRGPSVLAAATALTEQRPLATSDPALAAVLRSEGGTVHPLANSNGVKP